MTAVTCESFISKLIVKVTEVTCKVTASTCQSDSFYLPNMEMSVLYVQCLLCGTDSEKVSAVKFEIWHTSMFVCKSDRSYWSKWQRLLVIVTTVCCESDNIYFSKLQHLLVSAARSAVTCESDECCLWKWHKWMWQRLLVKVTEATCKCDSNYLSK